MSFRQGAGASPHGARCTAYLLVTCRLLAANPVHENEVPGAWQWANRHFDDARGIAPRQGAPQRAAQVFGRVRARRFGAKASGKGDEIGIGEVAAYQPIAVTFLLNAPHIAEGAVVEHDGDQRNTVAYRRGKLCRGEKEAAIARNRYDRHVGPCMLRAERGGETP